MSEIEVGKVTDYFTQRHVLAMKVEREPLHVGDTLHVQGHTTDVMIPIASMQLDHRDIVEAKPGDEVGIGCDERVRKHDHVFVVH